MIKIKPFTSEQLSRLICEDYNGTNFIGYKFKISNSPLIRINKESKNIISCTCRLHSIKDIDMKKDCRFISALRLWMSEKSN